MLPHTGRILLFALLLPAAAGSQVQPSPNQAERTELPLAGVVTRAASPTDFDLNAVRVLCGPQTLTGPGANNNLIWRGCPRETPYLGELVAAWGWPNRKQHAFAADRLVVGLVLPEIDSRAVVEQVHPASPGGTLVRADGYNILLTSGTKLHYNSPLRSLSDLAPNLWMAYKGRLRDDGVVIASDASFSPVSVGAGEQELIARSDKAAAALAPGAKRPSKFQPWPDAALQARVQRIGDSLVPAFERPSPTSDPILAPIRFEVVGARECHGTQALPNGLILVCGAAVQRLQNDSQIAELLAFDIASIVEHQGWRTTRDREVITAVALADPFLLPAAFGFSYGNKSVLALVEMAQDARVSLWLMQDAGYDVYQAPTAWWLIAPKKPQPIAGTPMPLQSELLYMNLGLQWRKTSPRAPSPPSQK